MARALDCRSRGQEFESPISRKLCHMGSPSEKTTWGIKSVREMVCLKIVLSEYTPEHSEDAYRLREEGGRLFLDRMSEATGAWLGFYAITDDQAEWLVEELSYFLSRKEALSGKDAQETSTPPKEEDA